MSLGLCIVQENFILASTDSAVTIFPIDEEKYKETGEIVKKKDEMIKTELKSKKSLKLSKNVMLITTGTSALTDVIETELYNRITDESDLIECRDVAKEVMTNLRNGHIEFMDEVIEKISRWLPGYVPKNIDKYTEEIKSCLTLIDSPLDLSAYIVGFTGDGRSGLVDIKSDALVFTPDNEEQGYPVFIAGGSDQFNLDSNKFKHAISVPASQRSLETFIDRMIYIHANISSESPINVSSDCNFCVMFKTVEGIQYTEFTIDTANFYESLKLTK